MADETTEFAEEAVEAPERPAGYTPERELNYVMVQHMGYAPETKTHRAVRAGRRRQRFMLDNGRRIRTKGERYTEVSLDDLYKNLNTFLAGVRDGTVAVCRPDNLEPLTLEQLADLGQRLIEDAKFDMKVDQTLLEPLVSDQTDTKVWVEKDEDDEKEETEPEDTDDVDATSPDLGQGALMAQVDQHEAEAKGEANPPPAPQEVAPPEAPAAAEPPPAPEAPPAAAPAAEEEEGLTKEQLLEMPMKELQKIAKDYGVKNLNKLKQPDLVDAIMKAAAEQE